MIESRCNPVASLSVTKCHYQANDWVILVVLTIQPSVYILIIGVKWSSLWVHNRTKSNNLHNFIVRIQSSVGVLIGRIAEVDSCKHLKTKICFDELIHVLLWILTKNSYQDRRAKMWRWYRFVTYGKNSPWLYDSLFLPFNATLYSDAL